MFIHNVRDLTIEKHYIFYKLQNQPMYKLLILYRSESHSTEAYQRSSLVLYQINIKETYIER